MDTASERFFDTYGEYRNAIRAALGQAQRSIAIFDPDLRECGLENRAGMAQLESLCLRSPHRHALRILLHSTTPIEKECPRMIHLLARFAHRASVRTTDPGTRNWPQPFLVADGELAVMRFHLDLPRGKICAAGSRTIAYLDTQFETMWLNGKPCAIGSPLGI
jgi:hypothetical protein